MVGKEIRLERLIDRNSGKTIIVPMDHGVSAGPIAGLIDMGKTVDAVANGGANAVLGHIGLPLYGHRQCGKDIGLILHVSASTSLAPDPNSKVIVNSVTRALTMGADGVSIHVNIGANDEKRMLYDFGILSSECRRWGMPLLAMMYARGEKIKKETDVSVVKQAARVGAELGADIVKCAYTGSPETFREVVEGCPVPVIIAGGERMETDRDVFQMIYDSISVGAAGVSIGRNVFQHTDPERVITAIHALVFNAASVDEAVGIMK